MTDYRWLVQEDATYHIDPATPPSLSETLSTNFHKSYMPVVAQGAGAIDDSPNSRSTRRSTTTCRSCPTTPAPATATRSAALRSRPAPTAVTVIVNKQPIPTAQISVIVFEDIAPTNGVPDPTEPRLGGFQITLEDAGGRYGISGGTMSQDAFGNPLKNSLDCFGGSPPPAGVIVTCPDGTALIKDLPPGKYGVVVVAARRHGRDVDADLDHRRHEIAGHLGEGG